MKDYDNRMIDITMSFLTYYMNDIVQIVMDTDCSDEIFRKKVEGATTHFFNELKKNTNWNDFDEETCKKLGFGNWKDGIKLIPLYLLPIIPIGTELISIMGNSIQFDGNNIDTDTRGGLLAYGIKVKKKSKNGK